MFLAYDPTTNPLNNNEWSFPLTECVHISTFAMSVGTIALVDLRLLGWAFRRESPAQMLKSTSLWTLAGLIIVITSGFIIWTSDPVRYYYNWSFRYKIIALLFAIIFNYTIHRKVAMSDNSSAGVRAVVGVVSLLLWVSVVFGGLFIAFA